MISDLDLLRRFARENSQDAFGEIVRRHLNLVYSAALRQVRSPQLAEEIAQSVFADLARDADKISGTGVSPVSSLTPWLYSVTRRTAIDVIRKESRRQLREQIAYEMNAMNATANDWTQIAPLLDDAMVALDETDRSAILLRYFENKNLREVGASLKISDDAAQKRVSRAVEKLGEFFSKRNVTIGAGGLVVLISANAVQSAPVALFTTVSTAVIAGTAVKTSALIAATKTIAMTTIQKTLITATIAVIAGAGIYETHRAAQLAEQAQTILQQPDMLAGQIQQLQRERNDARNQLAGLLAENARLKSNSNENELLKLRGEVGMLRQQAAGLDRLQRENRKLLSQIATQSDLTNQVSVEERFILQQTHAVDAITKLLAAVKSYAAKNNGQYPVNFDQLVSSGELETTNFAGNLGLGDFEFAKDGTTNQQGNKVILNLRVPIQKPDDRQSVIVSGDITGDGLIGTEIWNVGSE
jgi:RNA polymerase sigma factor (sigma-70 family)